MKRGMEGEGRGKERREKAGKEGEGRKGGKGGGDRREKQKI